MAELPVDIIYDILSRMPVKSLGRSRCVCKPWCNYIDDPNLAIMHVKQAAEEPTPIMFNTRRPSLPNLTYKFGFFRIIESKEGSTTGPEVQKDSDMDFEHKERFYRIHAIRGSCNGLLYLSHYNVPTTTLSVIHPLTKERYELPPIVSMLSCGLGFDASTNTFKMCVLVGNYEKTLRAMVHVLGTDSWREIPHIPFYLMSGNGLFAHGCLHWFGQRHKQLPTNQRNKVIRFDLRKEEFDSIDPPRKTIDRGWFGIKLVDLHGEVGFVYSSKSYYSWEVWVLKQNQWHVHSRFDVKPPLPCKWNHLSSIDIVGLWNKSGDILVTAKRGKRLFVYSQTSGGFHQVNVVGWENRRHTRIHLYRSSLLSIHGMKKSSIPCLRFESHTIGKESWRIKSRNKAGFLVKQFWNGGAVLHKIQSSGLGLVFDQTAKGADPVPGGV